MDKIKAYWEKFLKEKNLSLDTPFGGECGFGSNPGMSNMLIQLVLSGQKRATTSALESFQIDNELVPKVDTYYVVTTWNGEPCGIIKDTRIEILPYKEMTWELAQKEGEDEELNSWRENHNDFFEEDSDIMGYSFTPDMLIVFEEFQLVYK